MYQKTSWYVTLLHNDNHSLGFALALQIINNDKVPHKTSSTHSISCFRAYYAWPVLFHSKWTSIFHFALKITTTQISKHLTVFSLVTNFGFHKLLHRLCSHLILIAPSVWSLEQTSYIICSVSLTSTQWTHCFLLYQPSYQFLITHTSFLFNMSTRWHHCNKSLLLLRY